MPASPYIARGTTDAPWGKSKSAGLVFFARHSKRLSSRLPETLDNNIIKEKMSFYQTLREGIQHFVYKVIDPGVRAAVKLGITPNVVTTIGMLGNAAGAGVLVYAALNGEAGDYTYIGWAGVIIILSSIMDMVDGYMARTANMCSTFGAFYDSVLDRYCELLTLSGLAFYLMQTDKPGSAVITFLSLIGSIMVSYVRARAEGLDIDCKVGLMQRPERVVVTILGMILAGFMQPLVQFDALWFVIVTQSIIAVLANWTAFQRIAHVKRQMR